MDIERLKAAIAFYEGSTDGQYDAYVASILRLVLALTVEAVAG